MSKPKQHTVFITPDMAGERLDKALTSKLPELSRSRLQSLLALGHISIDTPKGSQKVEDGAAKVKPGEIYSVLVPPVEPTEMKAQEIALDIVFEDAHLLVVNKAPGMTVHPAPGSPDSTLVNALLAHCGDSLSGIGGVARPGIVHRIDKDTSGLLVVAKHDKAHQHLSDQLKDRTLSRIYLAVTRGIPTPLTGTITGDIGRHPRDRKRMAIVERNGKHAVTHYKVLERFDEAAALVECKLETGRTHQIRVHFAHVNCPLAGDPVYGGRPRKRNAIEQELAAFPRQALHAWKLSLVHPDYGEVMTFEAPIPQDMVSLLDRIKAHC